MSASPSLSQADLDLTIAQIRQYHRARCYAMEQRKRADLALLAFLRTQLGWTLDLPEAERKAIAVRAKAIADGKQDPDAVRWGSVVQASILARQPFNEVEDAATRAMANLARSLPVWPWVADVRGFGDVSLAVIIGEAGNLANYSRIQKLWKRMGLGLVDGVRQGGLTKNASKDLWILHGYSRVRRSRMWTVGDTLVKNQVRKVKDTDNEDTGERTALGTYGKTYLKRKEYEAQRNPDDMRDAKTGAYTMHCHRRAQRYMEKMLLRDLWQTWRRNGQHDHGGAPRARPTTAVPRHAESAIAAVNGATAKARTRQTAREQVASDAHTSTAAGASVPRKRKTGIKGSAKPVA